MTVHQEDKPLPVFVHNVCNNVTSAVPAISLSGAFTRQSPPFKLESNLQGSKYFSHKCVCVCVS